MKSPSTAADHIARMARKGDPSAFYSLFGDQARSAYAEARAAGRDHAQAKKLSLAFSRKMYHSFTTAAHRLAPERWLSDMKKRIWKLKPMAGALGQAPTDAELENFDASLQMMLQRQYCAMRRTDTTIEGVLHMRRYMLLHPALRIPVYAALTAAIVLTGLLYLRLSSLEIALTLSSPLAHRSFIIRPAASGILGVRLESRLVPAAARQHAPAALPQSALAPGRGEMPGPLRAAPAAVRPQVRAAAASAPQRPAAPLQRESAGAPPAAAAALPSVNSSQPPPANASPRSASAPVAPAGAGSDSGLTR